MKARLPIATALALAWFGIFAGPLSGQTTITFTSGQNNTINYDTSGGALIFTTNGYYSATQSGTVTGANGITKTGAGVITLGGTGDNTALTATVNAGELILGKASSSSVHAIGTSITINNTGILRLGGTGDDQISDSASVLVNDGGLFDLNGHNETINNLTGGGNVGNSGSLVTLTVGGGNGSSTFDGVIQDITALAKTGTGTFTLTKPQSYTGPTTVSQGTLTVSGSGKLPIGTNLTVASGATFNANGTSHIINGFSGSGTVTLGGAMLTVSSNGALSTFAGVVSGGALTKPNIVGGGGGLTLAGAGDNTGLTASIDGGELVLAKSSSSSVHAIGGTGNSLTINNGATVRLGGFGDDQIADTASVVLNSGGTLDLNGHSEAFNNLTDAGGGGTVTNLGSSQSTLTLGANNGSATFEGIIQGNVALIKTGSGTLTLSGAHTYTGATTINNGTLQLSGSERLPNSTALTIASVGTLSLGGDETVASIAGAGGVSLGGTLSVGADGSSTTFSGVLFGNGGLTKTGIGTLTLSGFNTYTGATTISSGNLTLSGGGRLSDSTAVSIADGGQLHLNGLSIGIGSLAGAGLVSLGGGTLTTGSNNASTTFSGSILGTGGFTKVGTGTLVLSSDISISGTTTVSSGTLQIGDTGGASGTYFGDIVNNAAVVFARGGDSAYLKVISGPGSVTKNGALGTLKFYNPQTYTGPTTITTGILQLTDQGRLSDATAVTVGASGAFDLNNISDTIGSLAGAGNVTLGSGTLSAGGDNTSTTFSGVISGPGGLTKLGTGTLTLNGTNTHSGGTALNGGTLALGSAGALGSSGPISFGGGTLQFSASNTADYSSRFSGAASQAYSLDTNGQSVAFATALTSPGGTLTKTGTGTLTLAANNTYTGATTVSGGTLRLAGAGQLPDSSLVSVAGGATWDLNGISDTVASITGFGHITLGAATLTAGGDIDSIFSGIVSGTGGLTKAGTGTLMLAGANTFSGPTTISAGVLQIGNGGTTGSIASGSVVDNGSLAFNRSDAVTFSGIISGSGSLTKLGAGTLTLSGANTYAGGTTISAGTLNISSDANLGPTSGALTLNGGTFHNTSDMVTARQLILGASGGTIQAGGYYTLTNPVTGTGGLTSTGSNYLTLTGNQTYSGATTINAGFFKIESGSLASSSVSVASSATFYFSNGGGIYAGNITGAGAFGRGGSGATILTGAASHTGGTTIDSGTLQIGSGGTAGSIAGNITNNGKLAFNRSDALTYSGVISGTGSVAQSGTGTLTLSGANSYVGGTTLNSGTIGIGNDSALSNGAITINGGEIRASGAPRTVANSVALNGSFTLGRLTTFSGPITLGNNITITSANPDVSGSTSSTLSGVISGAYGLTFNEGSNPTGTIVLGGANTYTGNTTINAGIISLGNSLALGSSTFSGGAGSLSFGSLTAATFGGLSGSSNLTLANSSAAAVALSVGNNNASTSYSGQLSGGGSLTKIGAGTLMLTGANTYTGLTRINAGTLDFGSTGSLATTSALQIEDGTVTFNGRAQTIGRFSGNTGTLESTTLTTTYTNVSTFSGTVSNSQLILAGAGGILTLNGATDDPGATAIVNAGTLVLGKTSSATVHALGGGASSLTINSGGTLRLGGTGGDQIASTATVTLNTGGTFDLGGTHSEGFDVLAGAGTVTNSLSGAGTLTLGEAGSSFTFGGTLQNGATGTVALAKSGAGTLTLSGTNTYTGGTTLSAGTLKLGVNNALPASSPLTLSGGTLGTGGFNQTLGTLTLNGSSTIDFGSGASALTFGNSSAVAWTGTLSILNYTSGTDSLRIGANSNGLTANQLSQISFGGLLAQIDANGFVSPVSAIPEPSTYAAIVGAGVLLFTWRRRRQRTRPGARV